MIARLVRLLATQMSLRFDDEYVYCLNVMHDGKGMVYHRPVTQIPTPIPDEEMDMFIMLTSSMDDGFEQMPYKTELIRYAKKVRVQEGEYAGATGYCVRIKKDKRLIVPLGDLLMLVAVNYIPRHFLQETE